ncbi:Predicted ATPase related to phosphate starvation-inducible protein PhoH [hydrothermal vent metagenome]|uniref:Predicted ATPase related to phosphate starvation-inducible protein PhoH n=1 Tax=hydrothermal vent metagenome TaxID=652676 RepID=A0A3B0ZZG7_9ZZZZ
MEPAKRLFALDSNVLMHDPTALFRFQEHDIFIPMMVLEELDANKKGNSEVARNARQASRFLDDLILKHGANNIIKGLPLDLTPSKDSDIVYGKLFIQTQAFDSELPDYLPSHLPDNTILNTVVALSKTLPETTLTLVSKDINMRIKASVLGIHSEEYFNDKVLEDVDLLYTGLHELDDTFWEKHSSKMDSWVEEGHTFYKITGPDVKDWTVNSFIYNNNNHKKDSYRVHAIDEDSAIIETTQDYTKPNNAVWGIKARNQGQNFALNLLMNPDIDFVSLMGIAGTGKTLLTLAAGLQQTIEKEVYSEIIMTRVTVPVAEDIGFLPGTEEEKMTPWMGALMDNLEVLTKTDGESGSWGRAATNDVISKHIKIRSVNFMRGRTFLNRFIIIDEAQNLTPKQLKTLITRAGPNTKVVCLGNISQIDTPYLTETTSGLTYVVDRFKNWEHSGHITLMRGERSRLADYSSEVL